MIRARRAELRDGSRRRAWRGNSRVDPPEQQVDTADGGFTLAFRPRQPTGERFAATVVDADAHDGHGQLADPAGVVRVTAPGLVPGAAVMARLVERMGRRGACESSWSSPSPSGEALGWGVAPDGSPRREPHPPSPSPEGEGRG